MSMRPDIIVTTGSPAEMLLVVEVKLRAPDAAGAEAQLRQYMVAMRCALGMLITKDKMWLYRDRYLSPDPNSIDVIGEFTTPPHLHVAANSDSEAQFERDVQVWLESLSAGSGTDDLSPALRTAVEDHILPALRLGLVRAAAPRRVA